MIAVTGRMRTPVEQAMDPLCAATAGTSSCFWGSEAGADARANWGSFQTLLTAASRSYAVTGMSGC